jgi:heme-degrading monooxygenase HmoA
MAVKVLIERRIEARPGNERKALSIMREIRVQCLNQPGYISGETLRDNDDPSTLIVWSTWFGLGDWKRWVNSDERSQFDAQLRALLASPERIRVFLEGISDTHSGA